MLHFLKECPNQWLVVLVLLVFIAIYCFTQDAFLQRAIDLLLGGFLALVVKGTLPPARTITSDNVETQNVTVLPNNDASTNQTI